MKNNLYGDDVMASKYFLHYQLFVRESIGFLFLLQSHLMVVMAS